MASSTDANPRLRADIRDEPKQMLKPISGYEEEPLLPLEEACKPLKNIMDNELLQNIMISKMNSEEPKDGLTPDESASIHLYTMEWDVQENSLYAVLNRTLRLTDRRKLQPWFRYLKLFLTAVFKLPSTEHRIVWRGVPEDLSSSFSNGKAFTWWGVSSCTSSISVLQATQYAGSSGPRTMFSIETNSGKLIRSHSYFKQEDEILLPPGIYLQVIDKFISADGLNIIHLREISPPYKMLADPFDLSSLKTALPSSNPQKNQEEYPSPSLPSYPTYASNSQKYQEKDKSPSSSTYPKYPSNSQKYQEKDKSPSSSTYPKYPSNSQKYQEKDKSPSSSSYSKDPSNSQQKQEKDKSPSSSSYSKYPSNSQENQEEYTSPSSSSYSIYPSNSQKTRKKYVSIISEDG